MWTCVLVARNGMCAKPGVGASSITGELRRTQKTQPSNSCEMTCPLSADPSSSRGSGCQKVIAICGVSCVCVKSQKNGVS